jgi:hypothetical protein
MAATVAPRTPATSLYASILEMDAADLAAFRARLRRRYSREELIAELTSCATRIGASPTMREFAQDPEATIHPQTIVEHFGSWNEAKRAAGLMPRRRATPEELLEALRQLGRDLGRRPTTRDVEAARGRVPSRGVYTKTFGSMRAALEQAGFAAPSREEQLERSIAFGAEFLERTGQLPSFRDWDRIRGTREDVMTAWQLYRMFERLGGAWSAFQFTVEQHAMTRSSADTGVVPALAA